VSANDAYGIYFFKPEHGTHGWAGADYGVYGRGVLRALDYQSGKVRWSHDLNGGAGTAGVLTTATGLAFTGDSANSALALRTSDGSTIWHAGIGRVGNSPVSYEIDGRQYVLFGGGTAIYAFALPQ
jgi:alcohol dehydrogenase (cytochrome c)